MNISGKTMIFKSEYGYSTAISKKNQNGSYDKMYVSVQLPKNVELENKTNIEITKGFLSFYNSKDGSQKLKLVIMDFDAEQKVNVDELDIAENLPF